jgi:pyruvate dehydrogenase complex dehydrogenase (E1) component
VGQWVPGKFLALGTDGYGVCDSREALRDYFEISEKYIVTAALSCLLQDEKISASKYRQDMDLLNELIQKGSHPAGGLNQAKQAG